MPNKTSLLSAAAIVALASPALAQDLRGVAPMSTDPKAAQSAPINASADIIVTATRRSERLSSVPIAVTAFGTGALQNSGATDIRQVTQLAPSLLVMTAGSEANATARVRGIGTVGDNPGLESSVAVFIDGVYRSRTGSGLNDIGEVERIEVLRGPQGTLSGRNSSAGAISIYTKQPEFKFGGYGEASYGNYDAVRLAGAVTGPVIKDLLAFRIDGVFAKRDGFYRDVVNKTDYNDRNRYFVRGQLLITPNPDLGIRLIGDYTHRNEKCCGAVYIDTREKYDPTPGVPGDYAVAAQNRIVTILKNLGAVLPSDGDPYNRQIANTLGRAYANRTTDGGVSARVRWNFGNTQLTSITAYREYKAGGAADTDYGSADLSVRPDNGLAFRRFRTFTQESRLSGSIFHNRVDWLVGGFFAHENLRVSDNLLFASQYGTFAACRIVSSLSPSPALQDASQPGCLSPFGRAIGTLVLGPQLIAGVDRLSTVNNVGSLRDIYDQTSRNFAFFTHNIVRITDRLSLTGGLRYTNERKTMNATINNNNTVCPAQQAALGPLLTSKNATAQTVAAGLITLTCTGNSTSALTGVPLSDRLKEGQFTGTTVLSWKANAHLLVYASYARGYKAGGFNLDRSDLTATVYTTPTSASASNLRFDPETVSSYEAGVKYTGRQFTANVAAFRSEFKNFQLNTFNGTTFIVQNISACSKGLDGADGDNSSATGACTGKIKYGVVTQGVELELGMYPSSNVAVNFGYTYADAHYGHDLIGSEAGEALSSALFLLPGSQMSNAPKNVVTSSASWSPALGSGGTTGLLYVDGRMTSGYDTSSDLFPEKAQQGFFVMNARIGVHGPKQRWAIEFWGQNVFNTRYKQIAFSAPFQGSGGETQVQKFGAPAFATANTIFEAYLGEPRTFGLTLRTRF